MIKIIEAICWIAVIALVAKSLYDLIHELWQERKGFKELNESRNHRGHSHE